MKFRFIFVKENPTNYRAVESKIYNSNFISQRVFYNLRNQVVSTLVLCVMSH
jgi:hypothetical protein